ncbi:hypothetical protein Tco_0578117 [Tanacetum coccineum]
MQIGISSMTSVLDTIIVLPRKAKVYWEDICLPKQERGLGLRSLEVFNLALMTTHVWNIIYNKEFVGVVGSYVQASLGRTLWDIQPKSSTSWGWWKILQLRDLVKPFLWVRIGNGMNTSIWYDMWCSQSLISRFLMPRDIARKGFSIHSNMADLMMHGAWN